MQKQETYTVVAEEKPKRPRWAVEVRYAMPGSKPEVMADDKGRVIAFATIRDARKWIDDRRTADLQRIYELEPGENRRPMLRARKAKELIAEGVLDAEKIG